jgi:primosomal protein N' (replication factor Y)
VSFVEVAVRTDVPYRQAFSYAVPTGMEVAPGSGVLVPFGRHTLAGVVLDVAERPAYTGETRHLLAAAEILLTRAQIELASWLSRRYLAPLYPCVALMLPPGFDRRLRVTVAAAADEPTDELSAPARKLLARVRAAGELDLSQLRRTFRANTGALLADLRALGLVRERLTFAVPPIDTPPVTAAPVQAPPLTAGQRRAMAAIGPAVERPCAAGGRPPVFLLHGVTGSGKTEVYLAALERAVARGRRGIVLVPEIALTPQAVARFEARFPGRVAVLHSEIAGLRRERIWHAIRAGRYDVVIGPRSALFAPQPDLGLIVLDEEHEWTYKQHDAEPRYHARDVALKLAQLNDATVILGSATPDVVSYARARAGHYTLLEMRERVGRRGALTPGPSPVTTGERSLNQPGAPAQSVGSTTPCSYSGSRLPEAPFSRDYGRGAGGEGTSLPTIEIVDLARELREGNRGIFSRALDAALAETLARGEQAILFLNRRGSASFVLCRDCGHVPQCSGCRVPYSVHLAGERLRCHQCNRQRRMIGACPACGGARLRLFGLGTQRVEAEVRSRYPAARVLRWDRDAARREADHAEILGALARGEADVVVGTQMLAKGHDLPNVTLVGVVSADIALHMPDYRSGERAFQLLTQVAGRAGRGTRPGRVIVQTYTPEHYAIRAAATHDYRAMFDAEMRVRREAGYPPFGRLARLLYSHTNAAYAEEEARRLAAELRELRRQRGLPGEEIVGPAPAFHARLRGRWRWQIIVRAPGPAALLAGVTLKKGWSADIDPISLI